MRYDSYKNSGVEWVGEIPSSWESKNLKLLFNVEKGKLPKNLTDIPHNNLLPYLSMNVLRGEEPKEFSNFDDGILVEKNDIGILWDGSNSGEIIRINQKGILSSTISKLSSKSNLLSQNFSFYLLKFYEKDFKNNTNGMGIPHMDGNHLKYSKVLLPPLHEQQQIVEYLDTKTQQIDTLIEKTQKTIELLKEKRTSLINYIVTKGLNPNVELKDSGVEWIGKTPNHWRFLKLWLLIKWSELGGNYNSSEGNDGVPLMKMGNLNRGYMKMKKIEYLNPNDFYDDRHILKTNDFLFNTRNSEELVGKVSLWRDELPFSLYNSNILKIDFNESVDNEYMNYMFNSKSTLDVLKLISKGTTNVSGIYFKDLSKIEVSIPPLNEQQEIVEFLDKQTSIIDTTINKEEKRIKLLKEYRQSLISIVVTGKLKVIKDE